MAQKPDGKPAKSVAVTFTRPAAERIASVVRTVERSGRDTKGPVWNPRMEGGGGDIRLCTFTGQWLIQDTKNVRFASDTNATALAVNYLFSLSNLGTAQNAYVSLVKDPSQPENVKYHLINLKHEIFRVATFTGAWAINATKTVTFKYQTQTPNTASVMNLVVGLSPTSVSDVSIAKDGTAWFLLQPNLTQQPNFAAGTTQVLGHTGGVLKWIDTSTCPEA